LSARRWWELSPPRKGNPNIVKYDPDPWALPLILIGVCAIALSIYLLWLGGFRGWEKLVAIVCAVFGMWAIGEGWYRR
jgi:hypothetical protein